MPMTTPDAQIAPSGVQGVDALLRNQQFYSGLNQQANLAAQNRSLEMQRILGQQQYQTGELNLRKQQADWQQKYQQGELDRQQQQTDQLGAYQQGELANRQQQLKQQDAEFQSNLQERSNERQDKIRNFAIDQIEKEYSPRMAMIDAEEKSQLAAGQSTYKDDPDGAAQYAAKVKSDMAQARNSLMMEQHARVSRAYQNPDQWWQEEGQPKAQEMFNNSDAGQQQQQVFTQAAQQQQQTAQGMLAMAHQHQQQKASEMQRLQREQQEAQMLQKSGVAIDDSPITQRMQDIQAGRDLGSAGGGAYADFSQKLQQAKSEQVANTIVNGKGNYAERTARLQRAGLDPKTYMGNSQENQFVEDITHQMDQQGITDPKQRQAFIENQIAMLRGDPTMAKNGNQFTAEQIARDDAANNTRTNRQGVRSSNSFTASLNGNWSLLGGVGAGAGVSDTVTNGQSNMESQRVRDVADSWKNRAEAFRQQHKGFDYQAAVSMLQNQLGSSGGNGPSTPDGGGPTPVGSPPPSGPSGPVTGGNGPLPSSQLSDQTAVAKRFNDIAGLLQSEAGNIGSEKKGNKASWLANKAAEVFSKGDQGDAAGNNLGPGAKAALQQELISLWPKLSPQDQHDFAKAGWDPRMGTAGNEMQRFKMNVQENPGDVAKTVVAGGLKGLSLLPGAGTTARAVGVGAGLISDLMQGKSVGDAATNAITGAVVPAVVNKAANVFSNAFPKLASTVVLDETKLLQGVRATQKAIGDAAPEAVDAAVSGLPDKTLTGGEALKPVVDALKKLGANEEQAQITAAAASAQAGEGATVKQIGQQALKKVETAQPRAEVAQPQQVKNPLEPLQNKPIQGNEPLDTGVNESNAQPMSTRTGGKASDAKDLRGNKDLQSIVKPKGNNLQIKYDNEAQASGLPESSGKVEGRQYKPLQVGYEGNAGARSAQGVKGKVSTGPGAGNMENYLKEVGENEGVQAQPANPGQPVGSGQQPMDMEALERAQQSSPPDLRSNGVDAQQTGLNKEAFKAQTTKGIDMSNPATAAKVNQFADSAFGELQKAQTLSKIAEERGMPLDDVKRISDHLADMKKGGPGDVKMDQYSADQIDGVMSSLKKAQQNPFVTAEGGRTMIKGQPYIWQGGQWRMDTKFARVMPRSSAAGRAQPVQAGYFDTVPQQ